MLQTSEAMVLAVPSRSRRSAAMVILAATVGAFFSITPTISTTIGVFLKTIAQDFGWSRTAVAGALSACAVGTAIACPFAGILADRFGPRRIALAGSAALAATILAISMVPANLAVYYGLFFLAGVVGALPNTLAFTRVLASWFDKTRGLWTGFSGGVGYGGGSLVFAMIAGQALLHFGWRGGFVVIAALMALVALPVMTLWLREAPQDSVHLDAGGTAALAGDSLAEAMRRPVFWWMFSIFPLGAGCMTSLFTTIVPLLTDRGVSIDQAVYVVQAFAFSTILAEPFAGWLADRSRRPLILVPLFLIAALGTTLLVLVQSGPVLLLSGVLMGLGAGMEFTLLLYMVTRYFGLREFGRIAGVFLAGTLGFGAIVPLILNGTFDLTGSYDPAIYAVIAVLIYSGGAILACGPYRYAHAH